MRLGIEPGPTGGPGKPLIIATSVALIGMVIVALVEPWLGGHTLQVPAFVLPGLVIALVLLWIQLGRFAANRRSLRQLEKTHLATIEALSLAIDARDPHTRGHVRRVQAFSLELARQLDLPEDQFAALRTAALLHDIGKLAVPDHLLHKRGKLTERELQKIQVHPSVGSEILGHVEFPVPVLPIIRHHHERWDGSGYPDGLRGDAIPRGARLLAVADAFEAMTSDRVYRGRKSADEACALIEAWSGIHFDPEVARVLRVGLPEIAAAGERASQAQEAITEDRKMVAGGSVPPDATASNPAEGPPGVPVDAGGFGESLHHGITSDRPRPEGGTEDLTDPGNIITVGGSALRDISSAHREVYALYEIAQTLGSSLRLAEVLEMVIHHIGRLVPYYTCAIYLADESGETLSARFVSGANARELRGRSILMGEGITGKAASDRTARISPDAALDLAGATFDTSIYSTVATFPLVHDGKSLGAVTLYYPKGVLLQDDHVRMMDIISKLMSGAVVNGTIFAETQESALTDDLTGLPNSRFLRQVFDQELIRSQQAVQPMALLEMDLDSFKQINDRHGHPIGDRFLSEVSRVLKSNVRDGDILVRLSGDEFAAILPRTGFAQAALLTERLQQAVDVFSIKLDGGRTARAGVSIGIALYPDDGETFEDLMLKADYNMYQNKAARKSLRRKRSPNIILFPIQLPDTKM
ncbi:MAG: diguanylate cyclase [Acidobacteria bacterium]|nr:diguanylate cyclase [Acidobacteriota bacterium]